MPKRRPQGGKVADPAFRTERARAASKAARDIGTVVSAVERRASELTPGHIERIRAVVATWPPLTPAQRDQVASLLSAGGDDAT